MQDWLVVVTDSGGNRTVVVVTASSEEQAEAYVQSVNSGSEVVGYGDDTKSNREVLADEQIIDTTLVGGNNDRGQINHVSVTKEFDDWWNEQTDGPGGGEVGGDDGDETGDGTHLSLEQEDKYAAFLKAAGIGPGFGTIADRFRKGKYGDYSTVFDINELIAGFDPERSAGRTPDETARAFEDFVGSHNLAQVHRAAAENLAALFGDPTEDPSDLDLPAMFAQPTDAQASQFGNLALTALQGKISPYALRLLGLPSAGELRSEFLASEADDFREYVKKRFGLETAGLLGTPRREGPRPLPPESQRPGRGDPYDRVMTHGPGSI